MPQIDFQKEWVLDWSLVEAERELFSAAWSWYELRVENCPFGVPLHTIESCLEGCNGIDLIYSASKGRKIESIRDDFHSLESSSMRSHTLAFSGRNWRGEMIFKGEVELIQISFHILTYDPLPILHFVPSLIMCLA